MRTSVKLVLISFILIFSTCSLKRQERLFILQNASSTGLTFNNEISISDSMNAITFEYIYNGGGVAVGDVNNDGKKDLFFSGNMVSSRLYLNIGDLEFEDIT
ncbi:MAG: VCBS repeat-containing protein, partial [Cyclobacteriaceae bacterium]|nr:VCBS repeat-containing protein [Cyclobacteriaceae bacterium]